MMIKILSFVFLVTPAFAQGKLSACERFYLKANKDTEVLSRCELKTSKINAEVVKLKNDCQRMEGAPKEDCFIIRLCPKYTDQSAHQAPIILKRDVEKDSNYCLKPNYTLLRDEKVQFEATAICEGTKTVSAKLQIEGQSIDCPFEW